VEVAVQPEVVELVFQVVLAVAEVVQVLLLLVVLELVDKVIAEAVELLI
jgi:hypothetical protein